MNCLNKLFRYFLLFYITGYFGTVFAQNYNSGFVNIDFIDSSRNNRVVNCRIHYPSVTGGQDSPLAEGKFPAVSIGHGFLMNIASYYHIGDTLSSRGFIVILVNTEGSFTPSHENFGKDLTFVLKAMDLENSKSGSLFYNHFSGLKGIVGHSMGGGATFLAAGNDPGIECVVGLSPAETTPSAIGSAANYKGRALIFGAGDDCVVPIAGSPTSIFSALNTTCKWLVNITDGSHCKFAINNAVCNLGEPNCKGSISHAVQQSIMFRYLIPFLEAYLIKGDNLWESTIISGSTDDDVIITTTGTCSFSATKDGIETSRSRFTINYNGGTCLIKSKVKGLLSIFSIDGNLIFRQKIMVGDNEISLGGYPNGMLLFSLLYDQGTETRKFVYTR